MHSSSFVALALCLAASATPMPFTLSRRQADFVLQNGKDAIALNDQFKTLTADSTCTNGDNACVNDGFAQCVGGKFVIQGCAGGTICAALPLVNAPGTSIACTTQDDVQARIAATGASGGGAGAGGDAGDNGNGGAGNAGGDSNTGAGDGAGNNNNAGDDPAAGDNGNNNEDPQTSLTLDPAVIAKGFANDGQDQPSAGQVASLTSTNNFINFCLTVPDLRITDGKQIESGSCNPAPIGAIPSTDNMPSAKFVNPPNGGNVAANQAFTITMAIKNLVTGNFVNAQTNYFSAPQKLQNGKILGHSHFVIEELQSLDQTTPTNPKDFVFFKGANEAAVNGQLSAEVTNGLPNGSYRLCSINSSSNHQPVIVPVAQHGSLDDCVYFTSG